MPSWRIVYLSVTTLHDFVLLAETAIIKWGDNQEWILQDNLMIYGEIGMICILFTYELKHQNGKQQPDCLQEANI